MFEHGESKNPRIETTQLSATPVQDKNGGLAGMLTSTQTQTVSEKWCETCNAWVEVRGIMAAFGCPECGTMWNREDEQLRQKSLTAA